MRCPKCQFDHELQTAECLKCGIVFARYQAALDAATKPAGLAAPMLVALIARSDALWELYCRILALPLALLVARLLAGTGLRMVASMLAMVLHESGHAITAWLTGRWAVPLHVSVQTTEKYLDCKQRLREAVNDQIGIEPAMQGA